MAIALGTTKAQDEKLDCICGLCQHDCMDRGCVFNKIMAADSPEEEQKKQFLAWMDQVVRQNTAKTKRGKM